MIQEEKDLCKTCKYYWTDFPLPLDHVVSHCEILDKKKGLSADMDSEVPYPCLECPFNCYVKEDEKEWDMFCERMYGRDFNDK